MRKPLAKAIENPATEKPDRLKPEAKTKPKTKLRTILEGGRHMTRISFAKIAMAVAGAAILAFPFVAKAQEEGGTKTAREVRAIFDNAVKGKTVAFLPIALGVPLQDEWWRAIRTEAEWHGMKAVVRDPNNNPSAMQQALTALVNDKPDVLIVQNPSVTLLVKELKRAENQGTHVIQVNMSSNYKSDAFVGADWYEIGRMLAEDAVKECGTGSGKSGKIQIVQGELTAAASVDQIAGIMDVFKKDPTIKVVSNQAANWDANTALNITSTVIQQHPDLCASIGFWGIMESGAAQAIRNAGKIDQVKVYASVEGSTLDCDQINSGNFYKVLSYKATEQGHDLVATAVTLLENGDKPGTKHLAYFTQPAWLDKSNASGGNCFKLPASGASSPVPMPAATK
jgi:ribose transport system substrate-binding protein